MVKRSPARWVEHNPLLHRLANEDLAADAATWTNLITHLLHNTPEPSWEIQHYLPGIVTVLKGAAPAIDLSALIDEAMRLGCTDAPDW
ncbi:MAG: hypothetical protein JWO98_4014 [Frankiales bacterium]|nr:hypothetical protein [Frankiales bacterium]